MLYCITIFTKSNQLANNLENDEFSQGKRVASCKNTLPCKPKTNQKCLYRFLTENGIKKLNEITKGNAGENVVLRAALDVSSNFRGCKIQYSQNFFFLV